MTCMPVTAKECAHIVRGKPRKLYNAGLGLACKLGK
jgi:hypothetical protein